MKFKYEDIRLNKELEGELSVLRYLIHKLIPLNTDNFATDNGEYELKLTLTGNKEVELDVPKLLKLIDNYGKETEKENEKLKSIVYSIRSNINGFIDNELNSLDEDIF